MDIQQLEQVIAIVEEKTMTKAAEKLHVTQPALSAGIRKLEEELHTKLFVREKNGMVLTEVGKIVYEKAIIIKQDMDRLKDSVNEYLSDSSLITVGFDDPGPMWYLMPNLYMAYGNEAFHNLMDLHIKDALLKGKCQIAISSVPFYDDSFVSEKLVEESLYLSVSLDSAYANRDSIDLLKENLDEIHRYVCEGAHDLYLEGFWKKVTEKTKVHTYTDYFMFQNILQNEEIVTTTTKLVQSYRNDGNRKLIPITSDGTKNDYYVIYPKGKYEEYISYIKYVFSKVKEKD